MTIEFDCPYCAKQLKTSDDKAGRQAKCPGCQEVISIPELNDAAETDGDSDAEGFSDREPTDSASFSSEPEAAQRFCPMCGDTVEPGQVRCRSCGEPLKSTASTVERLSNRREMRPFPPGEVIAQAWKLFGNNIVLLVGTFLLQILLTFITTTICVIPISLAGAAYDQGNEIGAILLGVIGAVLSVLAVWFSYFLLAGYQILQLKIVREEPVEFSQLFSGSRSTGGLFLSALLGGTIVAVGFAACFLPGIFLAALFYPFPFVAIAEDLSGIECLRRAQKLTRGNKGSIFILLLVSAFAYILGATCIYVGLIFAIPFINLLCAASYDRMAHQTPIGDLARQDIDFGMAR